MSIRIISTRSMADRAESNKVPTRNAPNSDQEPQRSRGSDDRPTPPPRDEMNRKTAPDRDSVAPSSPAPVANRITATESPTKKSCNGLLQQNRHKADIPRRVPVHDGRQFAGLLRPRRQRPRSRTAEQRDELAPLHLCGHSMTSSASASSVGGISTPNAFAVARLMTSSNLAPTSTGRSPGFSPLRIRPT